jgi:hypothetical protein
MLYHPSLTHNLRGAPYDDFPESGWDKLMALNVKSIFYGTLLKSPPNLLSSYSQFLLVTVGYANPTQTDMHDTTKF